MKISFKLRSTQTLPCTLSQRTFSKDGGVFYLSALQIFNLFNILSLFCLETKLQPPRIKAQHTVQGSGVAHASQGTHLWAGVGTASFQSSGDGGWMEQGQRPHHYAQARWSGTKDLGHQRAGQDHPGTSSRLLAGVFPTSLCLTHPTNRHLFLPLPPPPAQVEYMETGGF